MSAAYRTVLEVVAMNYYLILGVPRDAGSEAIRSAFRALVRRYHPDAGDGSSADRFRQIVTAYETLNDPVRRGQYDRGLRAAEAPTVERVEPVIASGVPEPLFDPALRSTRAGRRHQSIRLVPLEDALDDWVRSLNLWNDSFFGDAGTTSTWNRGVEPMDSDLVIVLRGLW